MGIVSARLRHFIVARHNELRSSVNPPAEDMQQMVGLILKLYYDKQCRILAGNVS